MAEITKSYESREVEKKWYAAWQGARAFAGRPDTGKEPYAIVIPPPNVTGILTMGHVLNNTLQDILVRRARLEGHAALWLPGTDHAGIATQTVVERELRKQKKTRRDLGREKFLEKVWEWRHEKGGIILEQLRRLGASCDWDRTQFTMDPHYSRAVLTVFTDLFRKGHIYRGKRMVNWCPVSQTALSDEEVIMKPVNGTIYRVRYELVEQPGHYVEVKTTRPETIPGDVAIAVHPDDPRYLGLIGKKVRRPLGPPAEIPLIPDAAVDREFGTGALKITPAHDKADFEIGGRHKLPAIDVLKADGTRQRRILDMLTDGGTSHSIDTLRAMQFDSRLLIGQFVATAIAEAADGATLTSKEKAVLDALAAWSGTCPTGLDGSDPVKSALDADPLATTASIGCTAAHAVIFAVVHEAFADEIKAAGDVSPLGLDLGLVLRALKDPTSLASGVTLWDDVATKDKVESKTDILLRGLSLAANGLDGLGKPSSWQWGRVHTISLRSIFDNFGIATYNDGPYAASGGLFTVNVASPRQRALAPFMGATPFEFSSGPSIRFVVEAKPEGPRMIFQLPGGSDLHRDSPFYNNLLPKWLKGEPVEFPFGPGAVTKPALVVHVEPAN